MLALRHGEIQHRTFRELPALLRAGDLLVLNETRVIAARVIGRRVPTGGRVELLLLRPATSGRYDSSATQWSALAKPARRLLRGQRIEFEGLGTASVTVVHPAGVREIAFELNVPFETFLERAGRLPLPPYIQHDSAFAQERYQTIFARTPGSVAAPTASLHFTDYVFAALEEKGVQKTCIVLDVGLATFRPIQTPRIDQHIMHSETFSIPMEAADAIRRAKEEGRRIVAAGTTVLRALEGSAAKHGQVRAGDDATNLFITPGFEFRVVDALITNFHLPQSTLLVLVSAFAGREAVLTAYQSAVRMRYRFFSFGDAMYIEP